MTQTKKCPLCAEEILADALKCKHCHEVIVTSVPASINKSGSSKVEKIALILFGGMMLFALLGAVTRSQSIVSILFGALLIYGLWFYPIRLAVNLCKRKNRNPEKGALVAVLSGWIGYLFLFLLLKTRDSKTGRLI